MQSVWWYLHNKKHFGYYPKHSISHKKIIILIVICEIYTYENLNKSISIDVEKYLWIKWKVQFYIHSSELETNEKQIVSENPNSFPGSNMYTHSLYYKSEL